MPATKLTKDQVVGLPLSPCLSPQGSIFFVDRHRILIYEPGHGFSVYAGSDDAGYVEGSALQARFNTIRGLCFSKTGNELFVADLGNHAIRAISSSGIVTTLAGTGSQQPRLDVPERIETAGFSFPSSVFVADNGDIYVTEAGSDMLSVICAKTQTVSKLAGGVPMVSGGHVQSCTFRSPQTLHQGFYGEILVTSKPYADGRSRVSAVHPNGYVTMRKFGDSKLFVLDVFPCASSNSYYTIRCPINLEPHFTLYLLDESDLNGEHEPSVLVTLSPHPELQLLENDTSDSQMDLSVEDGAEENKAMEKIAIETNDPRDHPELCYRLADVSRFLDALLPALSGYDRTALEVDLHIALEGASEHEHQWTKILRVERGLAVRDLLEFLRSTMPYGDSFIILGPDDSIIDEAALIGNVLHFHWNHSCPDSRQHPLFKLAPLSRDLVLKPSDGDEGEATELKVKIDDGVTIQKIARRVAKEMNVAAADVFIYSQIRFPLQNMTVFPMVKNEWRYALSNVKTFEVRLKPGYFAPEAFAPVPVTLFAGHCWREAREKLAFVLGIAVEIEFKEQLIRYSPPAVKANYMYYFDTSTKIVDLKGKTLNVERMPGLMEVHVKSQNGQHTTLRVSVDTSFLEFKMRLAPWVGFPPHAMRLIFAGKLLPDDRNCANMSIQTHTTLHLVV